LSFSQPSNIVEFVKTAMALLRDEFPRAYFLICANVAGRTISIDVDGKQVFLDCKVLGVQFPEGIENPDVRIATSRRTILDAIDARVTIEEAIRDGRLFARGRQDYITNCHTALLFFVRGAVRSPSFPALLQEFRRFDASVSS
jgi:hypothetical protein